ncbi:MAG TPA: ABC transporter permease [Acidobacteriaceae bacterium]|nr:ABC transporter permease [Acidobacteriaceae bacterium]
MNPLRFLWKRRAMVDDLSDEIEQHLNEKIEALVVEGMPREEATHAARRAFGNSTLLEERGREFWMWSWMENLWTDLKFTVRQLRKSPGFTVTAVMTLALGIGATTAIFSLFLQVLLHSLPVQDPQTVVLLRASGANTGYMSNYGDPTYYFSVPMFRDLQRQTGKVFRSMAASGPFPAATRTGETAENLQGDFVTGDFFGTLGLRPALGRLIEPADDRVAGSNPVAVLSYSEWQQGFGGSRAVLNRTIDINAHPFTVVGVTPPGFTGLDPRMPDQIFVPMSMEPVIPTHDKSFLLRHDAIWVNIVARLQPGMTAKRAEVELNPLWYALRKNELPLFTNHPGPFSRAFLTTHLFVERGMQGLPFQERQLGPKVELLMAMALLVLLIACVNLGNLLLVRGTIRAKEIGVRAALGASRARLIAWVLIEGWVIAALGGAIGIGLGLLVERPLTVGLLRQNPVASSLGMHLLIFGVLLLLLTGFLSCLPSMLLTTRPDLTRVLHESTAQSSKGGGRLRLAFTAVQITLSFVLLVGACLLARSLYNLRNVDLGLKTDHLIKFETDARSIGTTLPQTPALMEQIAGEIRRQPGITSVGYSSVGILSGDRTGSDITIAGYKPSESEAMPPDNNSVSANFFSTFGIPLLTGRVLTDADELAVRKVAVVNEVFATHYFGGAQKAIGQMFCFGSGDRSVPDTMIVGVVRSAESVSVGQKPLSMIYLPFGQRKRQYATFYIRTALPPKQVFQEVRLAVRAVNVGLPVDDLSTFADQINGDIATPHLLAMLSVSFGFLAILLAGIGMYGVLAYSMTQRTREIGIRIALGASRLRVTKLVVQQVALSGVIAAACGVPISLLLTRYLRDELFQVTYHDPWSFTVAGLVTFVAIAVAAYFPVRRAVSVDPVRALRAE